MVLGNQDPPDPADHEPKSDLHCPKNRRAENLIKNRHSVLPVSYTAQSQTTDTKKTPAIPLKGETNVGEWGEIIGGHLTITLIQVA